MKLSEIHIRDPYILTYENKYYLFGTPGQYSWNGARGFYCSVSSDLENWSEPAICFDPPKGFWSTENFWAPEVHEYKGKFYMFASFYATGHMRATQILVSDRPDGEYKVWSCPITPNHWMCLDGTFFVEDGVPYMIFCHEWVQIKDGEVCLCRLSDDLKYAVGEPQVLFRASEPAWAHRDGEWLVTDGPFLHRRKDGKLIMIWSGFDRENNYVEAVSYSSNGSLKGEWKHCDSLMFSSNGGHGMLFYDLQGKLRFTMHSPNTPSGSERAKIFSVSETDEEPYLIIRE